MRRTFNGLHVHIVWATWDRLPLVTPDVEARIYGAILGKCAELRCSVLALGGIADHVHLLVRLHPEVAVASLARDVKGSSSHLMTHEIAPGRFFKWQGAYGAFAVEEDNLPRVIRYIQNQKEHHRDRTWENEWEPADGSGKSAGSADSP